MATLLLTLSALLVLGVLAWFLIYILSRGLSILTPDFIFGKQSAVRAGGGVGPFFFNSFYILFLSLVLAVPIGMGAGIYMAEYARPGRLREIIRLSTEVLAGVPSIVLGLFGLIVFVNYFQLGLSILSGALALSLLNLPILVRVTEEAIRGVPNSFREASLGVGATRYQTITRVVLPAALPQLMTGITLVAGRALGETAVLIFTAGLGATRVVGDVRLGSQGGTLAVHLWNTLSNPIVPDAARIADGTAALLVLMVLVFNLFLSLPVRYVHRRLAGRR